jgi:putative ABC transport system permease protein
MRLLSSLGRDLRFALRQLRQTPVVSAVALLSLALGIGANLAIFSLVNALMLKALPVHDPERLVVLGFDGQPRPSQSMTNVQWEYLRDQHDEFAGMLATGGARFNLNTAGEQRPVDGLYVSGRFFDTLGVQPILGRALTPDDDRRGGGPDGPVVVLSHGFWQRQFGGDPSVLGRSLALDGHPFTVVGVTPREFFGVQVGRAFDVIIPLGTEPIIRGATGSSLDHRSFWWLTVLARLAPGQTLEQAQQRLQGLQPALRAATMPQDWRAEDQARYIEEPLVLSPAATGISSLRTRYSQPLYVLLGIVALVLTIACANMANLLLAQSVSRRRELAVRLSLGAGRWQLMRQLLVESIMLSTLGAALGLLFAAWGSRGLVAMLSTRTTVTTLDLSMDWRVFGVATAMGVVTGLLFGVAPALRGTKVAPADALRDHARGVVSGGTRLNLGHGLVALQVALSFVLVFGSILFVRTLVDLTSQPMGFESDRVLIAGIDLRRTGTAPEERAALYGRLRDALAAVPGVEAASGSGITPVSGSRWNQRIRVPGYEAADSERLSMFNSVLPDYFRTMGTPLLTGRDVTASDVSGRPRVVLVNEAFAKKFLPGQNPIGRTFTVEQFAAGRKDAEVEIIGLVANAKYASLREADQPTTYVPIAQHDTPFPGMFLTVKTAGPPMASREAVLAAIASVNKEIVVSLKSFDEDLRAAVTQERLVATLSAFFGGLALLLAALGLYGVMSYSVSRRRNEIGIRMALGAEPDRVVALVLRHVAVITVVGLAVGAAAAVATGRFVNALLFNLATSDGLMITMTAVTLTVAAGVAGYLPARRAARIDPMTALRQD